MDGAEEGYEPDEAPGRRPGCDDARVRVMPRLLAVLAGRADAVSLFIFGTEPEDVDSVGDAVPDVDTDDGGAEVFVLR